jgi:hypothetical protein
MEANEPLFPEFAPSGPAEFVFVIIFLSVRGDLFSKEPERLIVEHLLFRREMELHVLWSPLS